jgi:putative ABC transport system permease protein
MPFDLRLALRALRRQPALTSAVVLTVGLAVAANTALFSIFDGLIFRPLPYRDVDRLVHLEIPTDVRRTMGQDALEAALSSIAGTPLLTERFEMRGAVLLEDGAADVEAWNIRPAGVEPAALRVLGAVPIAGRLLTDEDLDVSPPNARPVLIREDLWRSRFGGDPALIGQLIRVPGVILKRELRLVGVLPERFRLPDGANLWVAQRRVVEGNTNFATLAQGAAIEQVRAALRGVVVTPLRDHVRPDGAFAFGVLLAATGLLLLVAWVQVGSLLFARVAGRAPELGVRLALGASRPRLVRQFAAEGLLVAAAALAVAWILTPALTTGIVRLLPDEITRGQLLAPDLRTLAFSALISIAGVLALSLLPVEVVRQSSPLGLLRGGDFGEVRRGAARLRTGLLVAQLAVTTVLVYMAGLATHSFAAVGGVDLGFDAHGVVAIQLPPVTVRGSSREEMRAHIARQQQQWEETFTAFRTLPGIAAVAGGRLPFYESILSGGGGMPVTAPGVADPILATYYPVTSDFPRVMQLTVTAGRVPNEDELAAGEPAAIVNETLARRLEAALRRPVVGQRVEVNRRTVRIAAVVADFATARPDRPVEPFIGPLQRRPQGGFILARLRLEDRESAGTAVAAIGSTFDRIWPDNPSREVFVLSDLTDRAISDYRARAVLLGLIGLLCVPLALAGIAGALSYATSQRLREIGIRLALGAEPRDIRRRVVGRAFVALGFGFALGLCGGMLMGRLMSAYLFGVRAADPVTVSSVAVVLALVAWLAALWPARNAGRIEPAQALRS